MILIIVGAILLVTAIILLINGFKETSLYGIWFSLIVILAGVFCPFAGYEETALIETKTLYPLNSAAKSVEASEQDYYLVIKIDSSQDSYIYCIKKDNYFTTIEDNNKINIFIQDTETPILEKYEQKAKKTPFSLCVATTNITYVIKIPEENITYEYTYKGE